MGRRPNTTYTLLPFGREQFTQYVALLESVLAQAAPMEEEEPEPEPLPQGKQAPGFA